MILWPSSIINLQLLCLLLPATLSYSSSSCLLPNCLSCLEGNTCEVCPKWPRLLPKLVCYVQLPDDVFLLPGRLLLQRQRPTVPARELLPSAQLRAMRGECLQLLPGRVLSELTDILMHKMPFSMSNLYKCW